MKKRSLCLGMAALLMCGVVSCNEGSDTPTGPVNPVTSGVITEDTTITIWTTLGQQYRPTMERYIEAFKQVEPKITVNSVYQSGSYNDLENMVKEGMLSDAYPDLCHAYPDNVSNYMELGKAVKLDEYIDSPVYGWTAEDKADLVEGFVKEGQEYTVEGTWSVPFSKSSEQMFYNRDVLIGLDLSHTTKGASINQGRPLSDAYINSLTWEELFNNLCPAIEEYNDALAADQKILKNDYSYHSIFGYDSDDNLFITLAKQYGYGYTSITSSGKGSVDFNNNGMKNLMKTFKAAYDKGYLLTKGTAGNYINYAFTKQNCLFSIGSTGGVNYQFDSENPMDVGVARIPQASRGTLAVINQGPSLCVLDHGDANRKLASWLFYKFITNVDNSIEWACNTSYMGIRQSVFTDSAYLEKADEDLWESKTADKLYARSLKHIDQEASIMYTSAVFKGSSQARTEASGIVTDCLKSSNLDAEIDSIFATHENNAKLAL